MPDKLKTLLVYPRFGWEWDIMHPDIPLGVAYVAGMLREHGKEVQVHDLSFDKSLDSFKEVILQYKPDIIGIEVLSVNVENTFKLAKIIKEIDDKIIVAVGGPHPSFMPDEMLANKNIDIAVKGEGEITFLELLEKFESSEPIDSVNGIAFKKNGKIKLNPGREPMQDLDKLPFPARDLLPYKLYFQQPTIEPMQSPGVNIVTSRGCPFDCNFCQPISKNIFGLKHRRRSANNIIKELAMLKKEYNLRSFTIVDDLFVMDEEYIITFCRKLLESNLNLKWRCNSRVNTINAKKLKWMKKSGCIAIIFGVESGSQRMLDLMNKKIKVGQIKTAFKLCKEAEISAMANILMGYPGETTESLKDTVKIIKEIQPEMLSVNIASPMPGTRLYDTVKAEGKLNVSQYANFNRDFPDGIKLDNLTYEDIQHYRKLAFNEFYKSIFPRFILHPYFIKNLAYRLYSLPVKQSSKIVTGYVKSFVSRKEHKRR